MKNRPYFIKKDSDDTFGLDMFLLQDINKYIGDILKDIKLNSYYLKILLQIFHEISTMSRWVDASNLPIANYDAIPAWEKIIRLGIELTERFYLRGNKEILFAALEGSISNIGKHQKSEYYSHEAIQEIETIANLDDFDKEPKVAPADRLRKLLIYYHDLYDGSYKVSLSFFHFICDAIEGNVNNKIFDKYLDDDVSYKIKKLSDYSSKIKLQHNISWILMGSDSHIRNAIAHKRWEFIKGRVLLKDRDGWNKEFGFIEIDDLIRSLKIANLGMQTVILLEYSKHSKEISKTLPIKKLDEDSIHSIMYKIAEDCLFTLDELRFDNDNVLHSKLKERPLPFNRQIFMGNKKSSFKIDLPPIPKRSDRIKSFISQSLPAVWNYKKIIVEASSLSNESLGMMEVNLAEWSKLFLSDSNFSKSDYENFVIKNTIVEEVPKNS